MKLWVDDVRPAPDTWVWVKTTNQAVLMLLNLGPHITEISLDHDAGEYAIHGGDYIHILDAIEFMVENKQIKEVPMIHIHSMNVVGVENMRRIIRKNGWEEI